MEQTSNCSENISYTKAGTLRIPRNRVHINNSVINELRGPWGTRMRQRIASLKTAPREMEQTWHFRGNVGARHILLGTRIKWQNQAR